MTKTIKMLVAAAGGLLLSTLPAHAALNVLACEPEWGALVRELAGEDAQVYEATTALQDPHRIQARPSLLSAARKADLLVCTGADLEVGWLPILIRQSGNDRIQPGKPGNFEAAQYVPRLEVPTRLDRADGDVHAAGNPHIQTDPRNIALVATALARRLGEVDAAHAAGYQRRLADFDTRWKAAVQKWQQQAAPLKGLPIVVQHKAWPYLENWLGLKEVASLEPKPGVEPTSAHLSEVLGQLQPQGARVIVRAAYNDARASDWLAERSRLPVAVLPFSVGGTDAAKDLFGLFDDTLQRLLAAAKGTAK